MPRTPNAVDPSQGNGFGGFKLPTSNTTYAPNQFFDVCLPHYPRGVVRLVAYMIRKTLGWCDAQGNPQTEQHHISFNEFERAAGISRDMIRSTVEQAIGGGFIRRVQLGRPNSAGRPAVSASYELNWNERSSDYIKDPRKFRGFFVGEGNRTYIPNQFFDMVVANETLAVAKIVGSVIRFSIGFQNKWGHRRKQIALSYQDIQNYARIGDRKTLAAAIRYSVEQNYIQRVEEGVFDKNAGRMSRPAIYAVKWLNTNPEGTDGRKTPPAKLTNDERSEIPTANGQKSPPGVRSENPTDIQIKQINNTLKQQAVPAVAFERLREAGFDAKAAQTIASTYSFDRIDRQLRWIDHRRIRSNRLGMLRSAIEHDWDPPAVEGLAQRTNTQRATGVSFTSALAETKERLLRDPSSTPS